MRKHFAVLASVVASAAVWACSGMTPGEMVRRNPDFDVASSRAPRAALECVRAKMADTRWPGVRVPDHDIADTDRGLELWARSPSPMYQSVMQATPDGAGGTRLRWYNGGKAYGYCPACEQSYRAAAEVCR